MKTFRFLPVLILACSLFASPVFSQKKFVPLPENASLEETQAWLKKTIKKFSPSDYYKLKFNGCTLKVDSVAFSSSSGGRTINTATPAFIEGDLAYLSKSGLNTNAGTTAIIPIFSKYSLVLSELDADNIQFKDARSKKERSIVLNVIEQKNGIIYKRGTRTFNKPFMGSYAVFTVKKEYAEQIGAGLARAINLCQETN